MSVCVCVCARFRDRKREREREDEARDEPRERPYYFSGWIPRAAPSPGGFKKKKGTTTFPPKFFPTHRVLPPSCRLFGLTHNRPVRGSGFCPSVIFPSDEVVGKRGSPRVCVSEVRGLSLRRPPLHDDFWLQFVTKKGLCWLDLV